MKTLVTALLLLAASGVFALARADVVIPSSCDVSATCDHFTGTKCDRVVIEANKCPEIKGLDMKALSQDAPKAGEEE